MDKVRLTAQEVIENNKRIIAENNLKSWKEIHAFILGQRAKAGK